MGGCSSQNIDQAIAERNSAKQRRAPGPENESSSTSVGADAKKKRTWVLGQTVDIKSLYDFGKVLGKGQFGTTRLVTEVETGARLACKSICKRKLTTEGDIEDVRREVQIMYHLAGHPNVVRLRAAFEDRQFVHLVMDLCSGGELFDRIVDRGYYTEKQASSAFHTMASVIAHCHKMGVIHRDLKPENFLLSDKGDDAALLATDFGLSVFFKEGEVFEDIVGSAYYVAPEVLRKRYSKEADVWSLGILLYILLSGVPPFTGETDQDIFEAIIKERLDFEADPWPKISDPAKDCVRKMLVRDPRQRATAADILLHPWVQPDGVAKSVELQSGVLNRMHGFAAINKLKKEALKAIAAHLTEKEIAGLRSILLSLDGGGSSGTITAEGLRAALMQVGTKIPEDELTAILQDVSAIGNGTIDYEEFLSATVNQSKLEQEENLFVSFRRLDKDNTGFLTRDDMIAALGPNWERQGLEAVDDDLDSLIASVEQNESGKIDYEEFCDKVRATNESTLHATRTLKKGIIFSQKSQAKVKAMKWEDLQ